MAATQPDECFNVRGDSLDSPSGSGDSGGGVFDAWTSKMIGMCTGTDDARKKCTILPAVCIVERLAQVCQA